MNHVQILPVTRVLALCNPFKSNPWADCEKQITPADVAEALRLRRYEHFPLKEGNVRRNFKYHVERIAYLVHFGWVDPIQLDVGVPSLLCHVDWPVIDGNHRLAAASFRGDLGIEAEVGGCLDYAEELFGVNFVENGLTDASF